MHEYDFRLAFSGLHLGHDVRLPPAPFREVRKELFFEELQRLEIQALGNVGIEEPHELLEAVLQHRLEELVMSSHRVTSKEIDEKSRCEPPSNLEKL